jgi:tetratricopeptide (TPR) repeat protein
MKLSVLVVAALTAIPASASAAVLVFGGTYARSCYEAAEARSTGIQAIDSCNRALTEEALAANDRVASHVNRGIIQMIRGNVARAESDFNAALALDPNEADAWLNKAILNARYGTTAAALPLAEKALQLKTRRPALAYFVRAMAYEDSGNIPAAYRDLQRARQLEPNWAEPQIELKRFKVRQL